MTISTWCRILRHARLSCLCCYLLLALTFPPKLYAQDKASPDFSDRWIALIVEYSNSDYMRQYIEGAREQADKLGLRLEVLDARGNKDAMAPMIDDVTVRNVDGILTSHGLPEMLTPSLKRSVRWGIPVVSLHCELHVPGVTLLEQDDRLIARKVLDEIIADTGGEATLALIWMPGFEPFRKRMDAYSKVMSENPGLKEVARFGTAGEGTALRTEISMKELLATSPEGRITVVFACWDEYTKGAARAIMDAGRSEIRLYGIDASNHILGMLQDRNNPLVATVGVDSKLLGMVQVRMIAQAITGKKLPAKYAITPSVIRKSALPIDQPVTMQNVREFVPEWGHSDAFRFNTSTSLLKEPGQSADRRYE